jgi:hypothetical protein
MTHVYRWGIGTGLGVVAYVALVAVFMTHASSWFGPEDGVGAPMLAMLLLVFSAAVTGSLVFARPAFLALQGERASALRTLGITLATIVMAFACMALILLSS